MGFNSGFKGLMSVENPFCEESYRRLLKNFTFAYDVNLRKSGLNPITALDDSIKLMPSTDHSNKSEIHSLPPHDTE